MTDHTIDNIKLCLAVCTCPDGYHVAWKVLGELGSRSQLDELIPYVRPVCGLVMNKPCHILIAGAADEASLAMLDGFDSDRNWRFSVADYCKAPLLLAENYARKHQVSVKTICTDLAAFTSEDRYDMVFVFSTLCFMDANARKAFLESAAERLTADGKIICVARYFENPPRIAQETNSWETRMQRRVRSRFKDFPELIPALGEILTRLAVTRRNAMLAQPNLEDLKRDFKAVGLSIQSSTDIPTHHRVIKDVFHTQKKSLLVLSRDD